MNERIKELYSEAALYAFNQRFIPGVVRELQEVITEKFAELIVKECKENFAKVWYEQGVDCRGAELDKFMARFEQHFGVKE
jgi:hypothetical protein